MSAVGEKLITAEALKAAYDALLALISLEGLGISVSADEINQLSGIEVNVQDAIELLVDGIRDVNGKVSKATQDVASVQASLLTMSTLTVVLQASSWDDNQIILAINGVPAEADTNVVIPSPIDSDLEAYTAAGIRCTAQAENSLTFTAKTAPPQDISVRVVIFIQNEATEAAS